MKINDFLYYPIAGLLMGIGLIYPLLWPVGILGIAIVLWQIQKKKSTRRLYLGMWLAWTLKSLCAVSFFWSIYPIEWLPFEIGNAALIIIGLCWLGVGISLGTGGLILVAILHLASYLFGSRNKILVFLLPFVWMVAEIIGSYAFSIFSIGPGGTVNSYFSFGYVGYLLAEHNVLLQTAKVAGVYGLTVVAVFIALGGLSLLLSRRIGWLVLLIAVILASSVIVVPNQDANKQRKTLALITTSYPVEAMLQREKILEFKSIQQDAFAAANLYTPDYVIWPEDSRFFDQESNLERSKSNFLFLNPDVESIIIDSGRVSYKDGAVLQGLLFNPNSYEHQIVHKRYLVPQGEFIPSLYAFILRQFNFFSLTDDLIKWVSYRVGPLTNQSDLSPEYPGLLFCFEGISPVGVRQILQERSYTPFIAHPISHAWFHEPREVWHQLDAALKVQAVWNDVTIASAGNHAESKVYFPDGTMVVPEPVASGAYWEVSLIEIAIK